MTSVDAVVAAAASPACAMCGAATVPDVASDYITGHEFIVHRCGACGFGRTEAVPESVDVYYPGRYRQYSGMTLAVLTALYRLKVQGWMRRLRRRGRALEVGCGEGWMLGALRRAGWRVIGNERSVAGARAARVNGVPAFVGGLDAVRPGPQVDLLILFQVLEHLAEPRSVLRAGAGVLSPDGTIVVAVPNFASWQARIFGRRWFHLDVPRHVNHFSPESLRLAFEQSGLRVVRMRFVSPEHDPYGWIQSTLNALGFRQNLLTKWLMGMEDGQAGPWTKAAVVAIAALLVVPSILLALVSWVAGAGALVEVWGAKA